jgi:hypothetical protein
MPEGVPTYDIAVSFAGAQRSLVEEYVRACEALGVRVFYDRNVAVQMWGRNFIYDFRQIYGGQARYVVPFLSAEYLSSAYPMDEFGAATPQAIARLDDPYFLPIIVGDVQVPEHLLSSAVGYLRVEEHTVEELARFTADRVLATPVLRQDSALPSPQIRLPKVAPVTFSAFGTLEAALKRVGARFAQAAGELRQYGYVCHVRTSDSAVDVRIELQGKQIYGLRVRIDDSFGSDRLAVSTGWPRVSDAGMNSWATAAWDAQSSQAKLKYTDLNPTGNRTQDEPVSFDEFFDLLWQQIVDYIEQTHR